MSAYLCSTLWWTGDLPTVLPSATVHVGGGEAVAPRCAGQGLDRQRKILIYLLLILIIYNQPPVIPPPQYYKYNICFISLSCACVICYKLTLHAFNR